MTIEKNGKSYTVVERVSAWTLELKIDKLSVAYNVPKDLCATEAELREYVESNELF